jgi:hypothetical protein
MPLVACIKIRAKSYPFLNLFFLELASRRGCAAEPPTARLAATEVVEQATKS